MCFDVCSFLGYVRKIGILFDFMFGRMCMRFEKFLVR